MYSYDAKMAAVQLYIKYGYRVAPVIRELGYPDRHMLVKWYQEYTTLGDLRKTVEGHPKYTDEQKELALQFYMEHGRSVKFTIDTLGYPSTTLFKSWLNEAYPERDKYCISGGAMLEYPQEKKEQAVIDLCARRASAQEVAEEHGVSRITLYEWRNQLLGTRGRTGMSQRKRKENSHEPSTKEKLLSELDTLKREITSQERIREDLQREVYRLQLEKDILEAAGEVLKKDRGVNLDELSNREKAEVINALRSTYRLNILLDALKISKSSYCYQNNTLKTPDKYEGLRKNIRSEFTQNYCCYGYRRIHQALKQQGIRVSEKVIRRIMKQDQLMIKAKSRKKYSSYVGEVTPAVPNLVQRNFHAEKPNILWLTDITEFQIPAGKVYLSPIIDCFDGLPVSWTIGRSPSADLANAMLDRATQTLKEDEHPIVHSDRGGHYRWPGWIDRMRAAALTRSMSKKGCSPDNSACEGFFGRLKNEMFYNRSWVGVTIETFIAELNRYLMWYRYKRIKLSLGGMSPMEYRRQLGISPEDSSMNSSRMDSNWI